MSYPKPPNNYEKQCAKCGTLFIPPDCSTDDPRFHLCWTCFNEWTSKPVRRNRLERWSKSEPRVADGEPLIPGNYYKVSEKIRAGYVTIPEGTLIQCLDYDQELGCRVQIADEEAMAIEGGRPALAVTTLCNEHGEKETKDIYPTLGKKENLTGRAFCFSKESGFKDFLSSLRSANKKTRRLSSVSVKKIEDGKYFIGATFNHGGYVNDEPKNDNPNVVFKTTQKWLDKCRRITGFCNGIEEFKSDEEEKKDVIDVEFSEAETKEEEKE